MGKVIGMDLGTTNSAMAVMEGDPRRLADQFARSARENLVGDRRPAGAESSRSIQSARCRRGQTSRPIYQGKRARIG